MNTKHIIVNVKDIPKNIRFKLSKELVQYDILSTLTLIQAEKILRLIEDISEEIITMHLDNRRI